MHLSPRFTDDFGGRVPAEYLRPLVADQLYPEMRTSVFAMGDPYDGGTPAVVYFYMPPGGALPRHSHGCQRLEVVLQGTLETEGLVLRPGDVMTAGPNEMYGPHIAGQEGYTVAEYFTSIAATYVVTWDTPTGPRTQNVLEYLGKERVRRETGATRS